MKPADVFFADLRATPRFNLLDKIETHLLRAGLDGRVRKGDLVAVKLHFGEPGNTSFLRPVYVRRVVETIKALGARPFLTDTNTLYVGTRADARKRAPAPALGTVQVSSRPWARVTVALRKESCEDTPCRLQLPEGTHVLKLENPVAGQTKSVKVTVRANQVSTVRVELAAPP